MENASQDLLTFLVNQSGDNPVRMHACCLLLQASHPGVGRNNQALQSQNLPKNISMEKIHHT